MGVTKLNTKETAMIAGNNDKITGAPIFAMSKNVSYFVSFLIQNLLKQVESGSRKFVHM